MSSISYPRRDVISEPLPDRQRFQVPQLRGPQLVTQEAETDTRVASGFPRGLARSRSPLASSGTDGKSVQVLYVIADITAVMLTMLIIQQIALPERATKLLWQRPSVDHNLGIALIYGSLIMLLSHTQGLYQKNAERTRWEEGVAVMTAVLAATLAISATMLGFQSVFPDADGVAAGCIARGE